MTNTELMNLSIQELRDLNTRLVEVLKLKKQTIAFVNKETLTKGMLLNMWELLQIFTTKNFRL